jgi:hypothetical protein
MVMGIGRLRIVVVVVIVRGMLIAQAGRRRQKLMIQSLCLSTSISVGSPGLEFNKLSHNKPKNQARFASAHISKKNLTNRNIHMTNDQNASCKLPKTSSNGIYSRTGII